MNGKILVVDDIRNVSSLIETIPNQDEKPKNLVFEFNLAPGIEKEESHPPIKVPPKIGRNSQCPCGSNKKFKKCCGR